MLPSKQKGRGKAVRRLEALHRLVAIRQTGQGGNAVADKCVTFAYAPNGALETIVRYESLDSSALVAVSRYTYDAYGRLVALVHYHDAGDPLAEYTWTYRGGGPIEVASGGAPANALAGFGFGLDSLLATATGGAAIRPLPEHVWSFDAAFTGLMTQMTSPDGMVEYSYDARGQLTGAEYTPHPAAEGSPARVVPGDESYTYDANGNRTNPGYVTGEYNRLLSDGTYAYEYDAEGNRTKRTHLATGAVTEYVWDHRNRLVAVIERLSEGGPIVQSVEYVYDSQNRWIARSLDPDGAGPEPATATYFVYDDLSTPLVPAGAGSGLKVGQIILHLDGSGRVTNRYLWGPAVDQILADEQLESDGATTVLWTLTDHLNTVRDLAVHDPATGVTTIVNHLVYDAFGQITRQTDPTLTPLFAFTARPLDPATGLQNNLNRWYDAQVGRWISEDPIGFAARDANVYRYVSNTPIDRRDPTGLWDDEGHSGMPNIPDGKGGFLFDWTREDHGSTHPYNPFSTWRHFRNLRDIEADLAHDVMTGDADRFERHMHQLQDYYSHYQPGYRWWKLGHLFAGTEPDDVQSHAEAYAAAQERTQQWLDAWTAANGATRTPSPKTPKPNPPRPELDYWNTPLDFSMTFPM